MKVLLHTPQRSLLGANYPVRYEVEHVLVNTTLNIKIKTYSCYIFHRPLVQIYGVKIWFSKGHCKLAFAANLFTVPLSPLHGPLPLAVAEKCHSASIPKFCL